MAVILSGLFDYWNKAEVGRRLGLSRTAVWKHMKKWDIPLQPE
jgi:two-component system, NtrC family, response regulator HydG